MKENILGEVSYQYLKTLQSDSIQEEVMLTWEQDNGPMETDGSPDTKLCVYEVDT